MSELSGVETAIYGLTTVDAVRVVINRFLRAQLDTEVADVLFRAGRIDAVWAVRTSDRREVVVKAHRPPVDLPARQAVVQAQHLLSEARFPCPVPLAGPTDVGGVVLTAETLMTAGAASDAREPAIRQALAGGLARHIDLLRTTPALIGAAGLGPAWCRYQDGPWPTPHDPFFDFSPRYAAFGWLDEFAEAAAAQILANRGDDELVVGHADWYVGNARFAAGRLVGSFDWDLVADTEAVVVGQNAGSFTVSSTVGAGLPIPADVRAFLRDYELATGAEFSSRQRRAAHAAAAWTIAYNARCQLSVSRRPPELGSALQLASDVGEEYLHPR